MPKKTTGKTRKTTQKTTGKPKGKTKGGRPDNSHKITKDIVQIIVDVIKYDGTVEEACRQAGISKQTHRNRYNGEVSYFDEIVKKDEQGKPKRVSVEKSYNKEIDKAKDFMKIIARKTVGRSILQGDSKISLEFLKRRDERYKDKQEVTHKKPSNPLKDRLEKISEK